MNLDLVEFFSIFFFFMFLIHRRSVVFRQLVMHIYIYIYMVYIYTCTYIPLFVTLKKVYDRNVVNRYRIYFLLGVVIFNELTMYIFMLVKT